MNLIILGPQGSGKGTQAELLAKKYGLIQIEAGKMLRAAAAGNGSNSQQIKRYMDAGQLVPDDIIQELMDKSIKAARNGAVFDGFPRSIEQYNFLVKELGQMNEKIDRVINLVISEAETIRRLSARRICSECGEIYNTITKPSPGGDKCGICGGNLITRDDDKPEAIKERLKIFNEQTIPIIEMARTAGILMEVDGERPIETIHKDIVNRLEKNA